MARSHGTHYFDKFYIKTTAGNVVYDGSDQVTVQVAPQSFLRKRVTDLNTGELVLYDVRQVRTALEDVEPHLHRSPLYSRALDYVHVENSNGERIPRLRVALIHALAQRGIIDSENLERKILNEDMHMFSGAEYQQGAEYLYNVLTNSHAPERHQAHIPEQLTIEDWLRGLTKAPRDHTVFRILQRELGDEFRYFISDNPENPDSFYRNYRIWAVMRQQIMKTLNAWRGLTVGTPPDQEERQSHIDISREKALILSHFLKDVTPELKAVMVTDIERLSPRRTYDVRRTDRLLGGGVINREIREIIHNINPCIVIMTDASILDWYFKGCIKYSPIFPQLAPLQKNSLWNKTLPYLFRTFGEPLDVQLDFLEKRARNYKMSDKKNYPGLVREVDDLMQDIKNSILNGRLDNILNLSYGTTARLMENYFRVRRAVPARIFDLAAKCMKLKNNPGDKRYRNALAAEITSLKREISRDYDLILSEDGGIKNAGMFITSRLEDCFNQSERLREMVDMHPESRFEPSFIILIDLIKKGRFAWEEFTKIEKCGYFLTRDFVRKILSKFDLEELIKLRREDFILEDLGMEFPKPPRELYPN